ncbi:MAG: zinc-binding dehydrogenase, partial [Gammaproteobacteria bacterium]
MKAAVCRAFGQPLVIEDVTLAPPRKGEITVRLAACAICHSDIAYADGRWRGPLPAIYGHEASGTVTSTGDGVTEFAPGDRVLATLIWSCGGCPACASGDPTCCHHAWEARPSPLTGGAGETIVRGLNTAAFAEACVVDQSQCIKLPDDIAMDVASLLSCGVITGVGAVTNTAKLRTGSTCAVIGAGGVGLNTIQGARLMGASRIVALDLTQEKLATAREFGATDGIIASAPDVPGQVRALTGGIGVDYVFVAVGAPAAFQSAPDLLAPGGAVVMVGMTGDDDEVPYNPVDLAIVNRSLLGSRMGR